MQCDRCEAQLQSITKYQRPKEHKKVIHVYWCPACFAFLQEYSEDGEVSYSLWGSLD